MRTCFLHLKDSQEQYLDTGKRTLATGGRSLFLALGTPTWPASTATFGGQDVGLSHLSGSIPFGLCFLNQAMPEA